MSRKSQAEELKRWAERMGYHFGRDSPDTDALEKLCRPEMRDILRHVMAHVRPSSEARLVRKHGLLNRLRSTGESNLKSNPEGVAKTDTGLREAAANLTRRVTEELRELDREKKELEELEQERRSLSRQIKDGLETLSRIKQDVEAVCRDTELVRDLHSDLDMLHQLTSAPLVNMGDSASLESAVEKEVDGCLEEAEIFEKMKMKMTCRGEEDEDAAALADTLKLRIMSAAVTLPARLLFKCLYQTLARSTSQTNVLLNNVAPFSSMVSWSDSLFGHSQALHLEKFFAAKEEKRRLAEAKNSLDKATEDTVEAIMNSFTSNDSFIEEFGTDLGEVERSVRKWVESEAKGVAQAERTKRYNQLVSDLEDKILRGDAERSSTPDLGACPVNLTAAKRGLGVFKSVGELDKLIDEKNFELGWGMNTKHAEFLSVVDKSRANASRFGTRICTLPKSGELAIEGGGGDCTAATQGSESGYITTCASEEVGDSIGVVADTALDLYGDAGGHDTGVCDSAWLNQYRTIATVLEKVRIHDAISSYPQTLPIYNLKESHKRLDVNDIIAMEAKNVEATEKRLEDLNAFVGLLETRVEKCKKTLEIWMEQPFNEILANSDIDELQDFAPIMKRLSKAAANLLEVYSVNQLVSGSG
ncbi:hypothetical protein AAG570_004866 [Ranatra chinensis]|uniref:Uncharacterized protein n=1 Tax=Ranatra chinensis TaxID=642074 RepID=A0ABD0XYS3_9HEMI